VTASLRPRYPPPHPEVDVRALLLSLLLPLLPASAAAAELDGVKFADTVSVGGQALQLNGLGLRELLWIDIYVGGLYLPSKTHDAKAAIEQDVAKRIEMRIVFSRVPQSKMVATFREGLAKQTQYGDLKAELAKLESFMDHDMVSGDVVQLDYVPGKGTTIVMNGKARGTIGDARFMKALWSIFLGPQPASEKLKNGLLGT
jgi:hypothetical protein